MLLHLLPEDFQSLLNNKTQRKNEKSSQPCRHQVTGFSMAAQRLFLPTVMDGQLFSKLRSWRHRNPVLFNVAGTHRQDVVNMEVISVYNLLAAALTAPASFLVKPWACSGHRTLSAIRLQPHNLSPALRRESWEDSETLPQKMTWRLLHIHIIPPGIEALLQNLRWSLKCSKFRAPLSSCFLVEILLSTYSSQSYSTCWVGKNEPILYQTEFGCNGA